MRAMENSQKTEKLSLGINIPPEVCFALCFSLRKHGIVKDSYLFNFAFFSQTNMMVAPVLANLGPLEDLTLKPNPQEVNQNINWDTDT